MQAKRILGSRADTLARECSIGHAFLNMITPGRETTPSGVPQPPRTVRERVLAELRARGASRQKTLVENLRTVGARGLLETAVASARGLLVPFPEGPKPESRHSGEPIVLDVKTAHPVMEREAYSSFSWLDMEGYEAEIDRRRAKSAIDVEEAKLLRAWAVNGYMVLPGCVSSELIDQALADVDAVWRDRKHVVIDVLTDGRRTHVDEVESAARRAPHKLNDLYLVSHSALSIFLHERIVRMVSLILDDDVVGCNSLTFEYGSTQPAHIDHVYMTPLTPRRLVASWIALEDVQSDAGPLSLWPGSHRLRPYDFGGTYHYSPEKEAQHTRYVAEQAVRFPEFRFMAKKGDVLLGHALLVHGGSPIDNKERTRKSMACHYFGNREMGSSPRERFGPAWYLRKPIEDTA